MALGFTKVFDTTRVVFNSGGGGSGNISGATTSSATAGNLLVAVLGIDTQGTHLSASDIPTPTGSSLTWVKKGEIYGTNDGGSVTAVIFAADNAATGTKSFNMSGSGVWLTTVNTIDLTIFEVTGGAAAVASQTKTPASRYDAHPGSGRDPGQQSLTLPSAPASTSGCIAMVCEDGDTTGVTVGTGWTEQGEVLAGGGGFGNTQVQTRLSSTSTEVRWEDLASATGIWDYVLLAWEIVEAGGGGITLVVQDATHNHSADNITLALGAPFVTGRMWDDENGTDTTEIDDAYSEFEWNIKAQSPAAIGETYQFRIQAGATPFDTYTQIAEFTVAAALVLVVADSTHTHTAGNTTIIIPPTFPVPTSISGRKILDQFGAVYLAKTKSSWRMPTRLTDAEITQALEDAVENHFNGVTVWFGGQEQRDATTQPRYSNIHGENWWAGTPWASALGPAWDRADWLIQEALRLQLTVHFSFCGGFADFGCGPDWALRTSTEMYNAGVAIATRYAPYGNIVWHIMFDSAHHPTLDTQGIRINDLFEGINATEGATTRPVRWMEPNNPGGFTNTMSNEGWYDPTGATTDFRGSINCFYYYATNQTEIVEDATSAVPTAPVGDCEPAYVGNPSATALDVRYRNFATFVEGGCLINWGHEDWWPFGSVQLFEAGEEWYTVVTDDETVQARYCWDFIDAHIKDSTYAAAAFVTSGEGTAANKAAAGCSTTQAVAYFPNTRGSIVVNTNLLTGVSGPVRIRWYNPVTNVYTTDTASVAKTTSQSVTYPSVPARSSPDTGTTDMVLIVDAAGTLSVADCTHDHSADNVLTIRGLLVQNVVNYFQTSPQLDTTIGSASTPTPGALPNTCCILFKVVGVTDTDLTIARQGVTFTDLSWEVYFLSRGRFVSVDVSEDGSGVIQNILTIPLGYHYYGAIIELSPRYKATGLYSLDGTTWSTSEVEDWWEDPVTPFSSSSTMKIGVTPGFDNAQRGGIVWAELRSGTDPTAGTLLWRFDAAEYASGTAWTDARGRTWTLTNSSAVLKELALLVNGALVVQDSTHAVTSDNVSLVPNLIVADATHVSTTIDPTLILNPILAPADSTHAVTSDNVVLLYNPIIAVDDSTHVVTSDNVTLTPILIVQDSTHVSTTIDPVLILNPLLAVADSTHDHTAENVVLAYYVLAPADSTHLHSADNISLVPVLIVADCTHASSSDNITLTLNPLLDVDDANHAHSANNIGFGNAMTLEDGIHLHTAEDPILLENPRLVIADSTHAVTSDNVVVVIRLVPADSTHLHTVENVTVVIGLPIDNSTHAVTSDNIDLGVTGQLGVANATHDTSSDNVVLTAAGSLAVADATHAVTSDVISLVPILAVGDATHVHMASNVTYGLNLLVEDATNVITSDDVVLRPVLTIASATHAHTAEALTILIRLAVADCTHAHSADHLAMAIIVLNDATAIYLGTTPVQAVYVGTTKVWP